MEPAPGRRDPLMLDLEEYASEQDATLTVQNFVGWLLRKRPQLARISVPQLETMARESLLRFAHSARKHP